MRFCSIRLDMKSRDTTLAAFSARGRVKRPIPAPSSTTRSSSTDPSNLRTCVHPNQRRNRSDHRVLCKPDPDAGSRLPLGDIPRASPSCQYPQLGCPTSWSPPWRTTSAPASSSSEHCALAKPPCQQTKQTLVSCVPIESGCVRVSCTSAIYVPRERSYLRLGQGVVDCRAPAGFGRRSADPAVRFAISFARSMSVLAWDRRK